MIKVSELTGAMLDYWAGKANGLGPFIYGDKCYIPTGDGVGTLYSPSTDWLQGGPISEREQFAVIPVVGGTWCVERNVPTGGDDYDVAEARGDTVLIAAMRCFVASKFGDEVDDS